MKIGALKKLLHNICNEGYGDWKLFFCDDDDDDYSVNHIYVDDDDDICLESTDMEGDNYDFTVQNVLNRIKRYNNNSYVYFLEEYEDGSSTGYDIHFKWYIGTDDDGDDILNIDCSEIENDEDSEYQDEPRSSISCPHCGKRIKLSNGYYHCRCGFNGDTSWGY